MNVKQITISGNAYERGFAYGAGCREEILVSIKNYKMLFSDRKGIEWEQALRIAETYVPAIAEYDNDYIEEMRGVAEGAGILFEEILAINARSEIMFTGRKEPEEANECTAFSAVWPATEGGKALAGQTWDFATCQREAVLIVRIEPHGDAPGIIMFPEAGMIGGKGMNASGVSLTLNALSVKEPCEGVPLHIRMRGILDSKSVSAAYARAAAGKAACAANLIITGRDGISLCLEMDGEEIDVLLPEQGIITHTNHFIGPRMAQRHGHAGSAGTYVRLQRARALLHGKSGITVDYIKEVLCDHAGYPASICVHFDRTQPKIKWNTTNFALIMDLAEGCAYFAPGNPCEGAYIRLTV